MVLKQILLVTTKAHAHPLAQAIVSLTGIAYFTAWSVSFYPQVLLNYKRKTTTGLSPDFIYLNPLGFAALSTWNWAVYFSPTARHQYQSRHDGHLPQVTQADLAFSLHALLISLITLFQAVHYANSTPHDARRDSLRSNYTDLEDEEEAQRRPLLGRNDTKAELIIPRSPVRPSKLCQLAIYLLFITVFVSAMMAWSGRSHLQLLDWLYFVSAVKLGISFVKYIPQVILNWTLRSVEGFAIGQIILDMTGSILSFAQLVVSSIFIEHDPAGIIANPVKLGLSIFSFLFDILMVTQKYWLFKGRSIDELHEEGQAA